MLQKGSTFHALKYHPLLQSPSYACVCFLQFNSSQTLYDLLAAWTQTLSSRSSPYPNCRSLTQLVVEQVLQQV